MSGLFTHRVLDYKPGFHFVVEPVVSDDEESVSMAQELEDVLNKHWAEKAPSQLTVFLLVTSVFHGLQKHRVLS